MVLQQLTQKMLNKEQASAYEKLSEAPVTVLQIGEGNFLRGFFNWMIHESRKQGLYDGSIAVVQPRPSGKPKIEALASQEGLYTLVTRGLENGATVERAEVLNVFSQVFDPYSDWKRFLSLAEVPELRIVVSNTTEAGLVYQPEAWTEHEPIASYPGKLTRFLYHRYEAFQGAADRGLICLPCELLERNGDTLRECILKYCDDWQLPDAFRQWVLEHNYFLNSLVDRIVTGYPKQEQAEAWFEEWGYRDPMLTTAEPYHLWAIEGDQSLAEELPLHKAGLNVLWVDNLKPYQQRKVSILNGAHTFMALYGLLQGLEEVRVTMEQEHTSELIKRTVEQEIIPTLPYEDEALKQYAGEVYERFLNPFIQHRLSDIAMNSLSKFKTRLFPAIHYYLEKDAKLPDGLATAFAALLRYYQVRKGDAGYEGRTFAGASYVPRDDQSLLEIIEQAWSSHLATRTGASLQAAVVQLLELEALWGLNVNGHYPQIADQLTAILMRWEEYKG
ncbi:tagaturonate reductase [Paenibacillus camelliae]|uniref:tagaturonate reductase n=1 Tax=Paenibacillus camelliae TaxID=512410 RepID=UPI00203B1E38|nr:tagaturonate reductase [Paenibacillus camelliae]MCM3632752.1 tagaturonate reductase [Paenibacillus camelliae]